jgi:hypothetical protein
MKETFTIEDLRLAFEAGENHTSAQWENEHTSCIGYYNSDAEVDFEKWFDKHFKTDES